MGKHIPIHRQIEANARLAYSQLQTLVGGDFSPGFYNRPDVLQAEQSGLAVCDAVLWHTLHFPRDPTLEKSVAQLLSRVEKGIDSDVAENRCHHVHAAVVGMLDRIGCPAVVVWGTVDARATGTRGFCLPAYIKLFPEQRPGHSWIVTPFHYAVDLAIAHQYNAGDDYELIKPRLPRLVICQTKESSKVDPSWFRAPDNPSFKSPPSVYANETKYQSLLGWSKFVSGDLTIRYLPGAVALPEETDLDQNDIEIGGMKPGAFFRAKLSDLVRK